MAFVRSIAVILSIFALAYAAPAPQAWAKDRSDRYMGPAHSDRDRDRDREHDRDQRHDDRSDRDDHHGRPPHTVPAPILGTGLPALALIGTMLVLYRRRQRER
jgi:Ni/Co efflux regulator RcnB